MPGLFKRYEPKQAVQAVVLQPGYASWKQAGEAAFGGGQPQPVPQQPAVTQDWQYKPVSNNRELADKLKIVQRRTE